MDDNKYQVFNADQVKSFQRLEDLDVIVRCSVDFVLETLCADPKSCWSKGEKSEKSSTMVAFVKHGQGAGRPVTYVRTVRAQIGPLKFCSVFYTSQFLDTNTVQMHCCEAGGGHLISRFRCVSHAAGSRIVYEEFMSAGALLLKLGAKAIRKARLGHLEHLKAKLESKWDNQSNSNISESVNDESSAQGPMSDEEVFIPDTGLIISIEEEI